MKKKQEARQSLSAAGLAIVALFFAITAPLNIGVSDEALTETHDCDFLVLNPERE